VIGGRNSGLPETSHTRETLIKWTSIVGVCVVQSVVLSLRAWILIDGSVFNEMVVMQYVHREP
jgi:hypothetical protein